MASHLALALAAAVVLVALSPHPAAAVVCPPAGFDSVPLDLPSFLSGDWFVQEQMITAYQREAQLFCVKAKYVPNDPNNLQAGIQVVNQARQGSVTGPLVGSTGSGAASSSLFGGSFSIVAFPANGGSGPTASSKLVVGPSFLAGLRGAAYGAYWVVAAGKSADGSGYDWAVISGGPPKTNTGAGCAAGPLNPSFLDVNGAGLWLFSRKQVDPAGTAVMRAEAARLGFDLSVLKKVQQEGCNYSQAAAAAAGSGGAGGGNGGLSKGITINLGH